MAETNFSCDALVLREVKYKEADRILTLFTSERGKITAKASGALRKNSRLGASTQMLTFSEMTFFENKGKKNVKEATVKEAFSGLRTDLSCFALGCYFAECIEAFAVEGIPDPSVMQLVLNSLYSLSNNLYNYEKIKAAFELKLMCILGYAPSLDSCSVCGKTNPKNPVLGIESGLMYCKSCRDSKIGPSEILCQNTLDAMRFIISSSAKRFLSFQLDGYPLTILSAVCENYLLDKAERRFKTLDYWKKVRTFV